MEKKYIKVQVICDEDGTLTPNTILWEDGRKFSIDKIISVTNSASIKYGAIGKKYICKVHGKEISLFNEDKRWFIE